MQRFRTEKATGLDTAQHESFFSAPRSLVPFTRACTIQPFIDLLDTMGAPVERFLLQAKLPPTLLDQPESMVPLHLAQSFLESITDAGGMDHIGVTVGQQIFAYDIGLYGEQLKHAVTIYDYLQIATQEITSVTSGGRIWLTKEGDQVRISQYIAGKAGRGRGHCDTYTLSGTLRMFRYFVNDQWAPEEICLLKGSEKLLGHSTAFGDTRLITDQAHTSFTIPLALLKQPIPPQKLGARLRNDASAHRLRAAMPEDLVSSIEQIIASLLPDGHPNVQLAAEMANMAPRTLQRRLGNAGFSYSQLLNRTRMRLAAEWLADTTMPMSDIATSLGYRDPANFTRAFRRKAGITPQQYRVQVNN